MTERKLRKFVNNPVYQPNKIQYLCNQEYNNINLKPKFQRDIVWDISRMNCLIHTIMNCKSVPGLYLYTYQNETHLNKNNLPYKYECIDGQHRLYVVYNFRNSTFLEGTKNIIHWLYTHEETGEKEIVFYKETDDTKIWIEEYKESKKEDKFTKFSYMTEIEKNRFDDYKLDIKYFENYMSYDERKDEFNSLQNGILVEKSDKLKNFNTKLIKFFEENNYNEQMLNEIIINKCTKKAKKYWIQWLARCVLLFKCEISSNYSKTFLKADATIGKHIEMDKIKLDNEEENGFKKVFDNFRIIITSEELNGKLFNPTQLFAVFVFIKNKLLNREVDNGIKNEIVETLIKHLSEPQPKECNILWEGCLKENRTEYFNKILNTLILQDNNNI
jgi:hypothetical protein